MNILRFFSISIGLACALICTVQAEPVYITGSVVSPGGVLVRDQLTLSRALAMVGGTRPEAKVVVGALTGSLQNALLRPIP